jgi:hypothetical protein
MVYENNSLPLVPNKESLELFIKLLNTPFSLKFNKTILDTAFSVFNTI